MPKMHLNLYLAPYTNINLKWIPGLRARAKTIQLLEENIGGNLSDLELGKDVTNRQKSINYKKKISTNWSSSNF